MSCTRASHTCRAASSVLAEVRLMCVTVWSPISLPAACSDRRSDWVR